VACTETAAANDGNFRNDAIGNGVYHFCACADDAGPFGVFANHEAVDVMKKN